MLDEDIRIRVMTNEVLTANDIEVIRLTTLKYNTEPDREIVNKYSMETIIENQNHCKNLIHILSQKKLDNWEHNCRCVQDEIYIWQEYQKLIEDKRQELTNKQEELYENGTRIMGEDTD